MNSDTVLEATLHIFLGDFDPISITLCMTICERALYLRENPRHRFVWQQELFLHVKPEL